MRIGNCYRNGSIREPARNGTPYGGTIALSKEKTLPLGKDMVWTHVENINLIEENSCQYTCDSTNGYYYSSYADTCYSISCASSSYV